MTVLNGYCTLADMLAFLPNSTNANISQLENAITGASRAFNISGKIFTPSIKTNQYDRPRIYSREIELIEGLLEAFTVTNGDGSVIASSEYDLLPYGAYPKKRLILKTFSAIKFLPSITIGNEGCISILGIWGHHEDYNSAWYAASTLSAAITTTTATSAGVVSGTPYQAGQIVRIDNELIRITVVATNTLTIDRGWNGSTATTHLISVSVKIWQVEGDIKMACTIQAARYFERNKAIFGTVGGGEMGTQAVTIPQLDPDVKLIIDHYTDNL